MATWYQATTEILLALYRYQLMSPRQLAILLGYEKSSIYRMGKHLLKQKMIRSVVLPFLGGNSKAYALTRQGAKMAWQLSGETTVFTGTVWDEPPIQREHSYGTNEFFIRLIERSLTVENEGLTEWHGTREATEQYSVSVPNTPNRKRYPLRPDGIGRYQFADGRRLVLHLEYDTGTESLYRIQEKLWNYGLILAEKWGKRVSCTHIMVITRGANRMHHIMSLWKSLKKGSLYDTEHPLLWCADETHPTNDHMWIGEDGLPTKLEDIPTLPALELPGQPSFLGKQVRLSLF